MALSYNLQDLIATDIATALPKDAVTEVISQAPFASVPGIFNLRDISGAASPLYPFSVNLRSGLVYRAGAPASTFTEQGRAALNTLGIKKIFDLRRVDERIKNPSPVIDGVEVIWIPYAEGGARPASVRNLEGSMEQVVEMYMGYLETHAPIYKAVFEHIRDEPETPFLFHCSAGKDRTGVLAALIHRLAGSSDEALILDFTLTRVGLEPGRAALLKMMQSVYGESVLDNPVLPVVWGVHGSGMVAFLEALDEGYGGVTGYLKNALGFSDDDLEVMKANLLLNPESGSRL
ncbi:protein-tyrosine phosphatase-like protein [Aspergillus nidulans var. acristatus]